MSVSRKAPDWAAPQTCPKTRRGAPQFGNAADGRQIAVAGHGLVNSPGYGITMSFCRAWCEPARSR